jgi:hypothetical protein
MRRTSAAFFWQFMRFFNWHSVVCQYVLHYTPHLTITYKRVCVYKGAWYLPYRWQWQFGTHWHWKVMPFGITDNERLGQRGSMTTIGPLGLNGNGWAIVTQRHSMVGQFGLTAIERLSHWGSMTQRFGRWGLMTLNVWAIGTQWHKGLVGGA